MFMLMWRSGGIVSRQVTLDPVKPSRKRQPMRSLPEWMSEMRVQANGWQVRYFAFRYRGYWNLCDTHAVDPLKPLKSLANGKQEAAEMWLMMKERADAHRAEV